FQLPARVHVPGLSSALGRSPNTLVAVRRVLLAQYSPFPSNGADVYEEVLGSTAILSTGNKNLDKLLDSGLYTGELTEFVGAPGSGKTQVCLSLAVNISCELKQKVVYVDSTGGLSASRLLELIQSQVDSAEQQTDALQRIEVVRVFDVYGMLDVLQDLRTSFTQQVGERERGVKMYFPLGVGVWPIVLGSQVKGERMAIMMQLARALKTMARELGVAVVVTNGVVQDMGGGVKPALGRSWSYVPNARVLLQREAEMGSLQETKRSATVLKSSRQVTELHITGSGTLENQTATDALDNT
uniref:RAD51 paralog D n=1 Tax=Callorhinchus milii TaxID=7868 RepID=A0A4W3IL33_CALMI